jgi:hypothetical protein
VANEIEAATMCFACGPENPIGLRIHFHFDGEVCSAEFTPGEHHVGFDNTSERRRLVILRGEVRRATDDVLVADCVSTFMLEQLQ